MAKAKKKHKLRSRQVKKKPAVAVRRPPGPLLPLAAAAVTILRIGSVCTGLATEWLAMRSLWPEASLRHTFACDTSRQSKIFVQANYPGLEQWFDDVHSPEFQAAPEVDVFFAGFPCQPFSAQGLHGGEDDIRGTVIWSIIKYIKRQLPRIVLLENVEGLVTRHPATMLRILRALRAVMDPQGQAAYGVSWRFLNSRYYGAVPQNRPRVYIACIRKGPSGAFPCFNWPEPLATVSLRGILDPPSLTLRRNIFPNGAGAQSRVQSALRELRAAGVNPMQVPVAIDCEASRVRWCLDYTPCLTAARGGSGGFWITCRGRKMTAAELCRLQGIDPHSVHLPVGVSVSQFGRMLGNAFTQTVVERLMSRLLVSAGMAPGLADRWGQ
jgi:site-specific DNA-cytosine methylase